MPVSRALKEVMRPDPKAKKAGMEKAPAPAKKPAPAAKKKTAKK